MITPKPISGFKELLPEEEITQQKIITLLKKEYEQSGFIPLETASIERNTILLSKGGIDTKEIYTIGKMGDSKEKEFSLRFDQTVPFARYVAQNYGQLIYPFKRYQIQKVFRGERPAEGRFREFYQADIDVVGDKVLSLSYDAEMISIINNIFKKLDVGSFSIRINNRKLQLGLMQELNIEDKDTLFIFRFLDKLDKLSKNDVLELLKKEIPENTAKILLDFATIENSDIEKIKSFSENELFQKGVSELSQVIYEAELLGAENVIIDTSISRGLDYYTGTIYETFFEDDLSLGSVCSGGRYDNLTSEYTKQSLPGVGVSIGVSRLVYYILKNNLMEKESQKIAEYLVFTNKDKNTMLKATKILRERNFSCDISFLDSFKKEMKYAQKKGYKKIVIPYNDEMCILRDLSIQDREFSDSYLKY